MGCKIVSVKNQDGKASEVYAKLSAKYSADVALDKYLTYLANKEYNDKLYGTKDGEVDIDKMENTPKFRTEFDNELDTLNYQMDMFLNAARYDELVYDERKINKIDFKKLTSSRATFLKVIDEAEALIEEQIEDVKAMNIDQTTKDRYIKVFTNAKETMLSSVNNENDGTIGSLGTKMVSFGIPITSRVFKEEMVDDQAESETPVSREDIDTEKVLIYEADVMEKPIDAKVSPDVNVYLAGLYQVAEGYTGMGAVPDSSYSISPFTGTPNKANLPAVKSKLFGVLQSATSKADMMTKLKQAAQGDSMMGVIYKDLVDEEPVIDVKVSRDENGKVIKSNKKTYPLATGIYTTFVRGNYNLMDIVSDKKKGTKLLKSNYNTVATTMKKDWQANSITYKGEYEDSGKSFSEAITGRVDAFRGSKTKITPETRQLLDSVDSNKVPTPDPYTLMTLADILNEAGLQSVTWTDLRQLAMDNAADPKLFAIKRGRRAPKFSTVVNDILTKVVVPSSKGVNVFTFGQTGESRMLNAISAAVQKRVPDLNNGSFMSTGLSKTLNAINVSSEALDMLKNLKEGNLDNVGSDLSGNVVLKASIAPDFSYGYLNELQDRDSGSTVEWKKVNTQQAVAARVGMFFNQDETYTAFGPAYGDRGKTIGIQLPKMSNDEITAWVSGSLMKDIDRIRKDFWDAVLDRGATKYENYSSASEVYKSKRQVTRNLDEVINQMTPGNASKSWLFGDLISKDVYKEIIQSDPANSERLAAKYMNKARTKLLEDINGDLAYLESEGVVTARNESYKINKDYQGLVGEKSLSKSKLQNALLHNLISTWDMINLFASDPALYKDGTTNPTRLYTDLSKRLALPLTPGDKVASDTDGIMPESYNDVVLVEPKIKSERAALYNEMGGTDGFNENELADGIVFVSAEFALATRMGRGVASKDELKMQEFNVSNKPGTNSMGPYFDGYLAANSQQKPFVFQFYLDQDGKRIPKNHKTSYYVVNPQYAERLNDDGSLKHPGLYKISRILNNGNRVQTLSMKSANKVGNHDLLTWNDLDAYSKDGVNIPNKNIQPIRTDGLRYPQVEHAKESMMKRAGSQMRVLIASNAFNLLEADVQKYAGTSNIQDALNKYNNALSSRMIDGAQEIIDELLDEVGVVKTDALRDKIIKTAEASTFENDSFFKEAMLETISGGDPVLSMNFPQIRQKIDSLVPSLFRKKVNGFKLPGYEGVQSSNVGTGSGSKVNISGDLDFIGLVRRGSNQKVGRDEALATMKEFNKAKAINDRATLERIGSEFELSPAEVKVSPIYFIKTIEDKIADKVKKSGRVQKRIDSMVKVEARDLKEEGFVGAELQKQIQLFREFVIEQEIQDEVHAQMKTFLDSKGNFDIEKIKALGLDEIVVYRIPTQGKNSMLRARIKEFLPPSYDSTIEVPAEIVTQSGSDFDIDKLSIIFREMNVEENKGKYSYAANNMEGDANKDIYDFMEMSLSSIGHAFELMNPNSTSLLEDAVYQKQFGDRSIVEMFGFNEQITNLPSLRTQEIARRNNRAGDVMIGRSSLASIFKVNAVNIGIDYLVTSPFGKDHRGQNRHITLKGTHNMYGGLISKDIEAIQNAALDNANNPLLGNLNINETTSDVALMLVSAGYGLPFSIGILNTPMVRDYVKEYNRLFSTYGKQGASTRARRTTLKKYGVTKKIYDEAKKKGNHLNLGVNDLLETKDSTDTEKLLTALLAYDRASDVAKGFSEALMAFTFGSKGIAGTLTQGLNQYLSVADVINTNANLSRGTLKEERNSGGSKLSKPEVSYTPEKLKRTLTKLYNNLQAGKKPGRFAEKKAIRNASNEVKANKRSSMQGVTSAVYGESNSSDNRESKQGGIVFDNIARAIFGGQEISSKDSDQVSPEALNKMTSHLYKMKASLEDSYELITDKKSLKIYDELAGDEGNGLVGEMDAIGVDRKTGALKVFDFKAYGKIEASDWDSMDKGEAALRDRFGKETEQLNIYSDLLRNKINAVVVPPSIIAIKPVIKDGMIVDVVIPKMPIQRLPRIEYVGDTRKGAYNKVQDLTDIRDSEKAYRKDISTIVAVENNTLYNQNSLSTLEDYALKEALLLGNKVSPTMSRTFQNVIATAKKKKINIGSYDDNRLMANFETYLLVNNRSISGKSSAISKLATKENIIDLLDKDNPYALGNRVDFYNKKNNKDKVNKNPFLAALTTEIEPGTGYKFVTLNPGQAKNLDKFSRATLSNGFKGLMASSDPSERKLANQITKYALLVSGFGMSRSTFLSILPPIAFTAIGTDKDNAASYFRSIEDRFDDKNFMSAASINSFLELYVQNFPDATTDRYDSIAEVAAEYERAPDAAPSYIRITEIVKKVPTTVLYKKTSGTNYSPIEKRGLKGLMVEFSEAESIFDNTNPKVGVTAQKSDEKKAATSKSNKEKIKKLTKKEEAISDSSKPFSIKEFPILKVLESPSLDEAMVIIKDFVEEYSKEITDLGGLPAGIRGVMKSAYKKKMRSAPDTDAREYYYEGGLAQLIDEALTDYFDSNTKQELLNCAI